MGRRRNLRIPVNLDVLFRLARGVSFNGKALNLSSGGLHVRVTEPIVIREKLLVEFPLPEVPDLFKIPGETVWCRFHYEGNHSENPYHTAGIKFVEVPEVYLSVHRDYTFKMLRDENAVRAQGILQILADIRNLSPADRLKAYHILINRDADFL
jgi:hypothetical protein